MTNMIKNGVMMVALMAMVLITAPSNNAFANDRLDEGVGLVNALVERIQTVIGEDPDQAQVRAETNAIIDEFFDFDLVARFAAGQAWRSASDAEKADYKTAFRRVLLALAETQFEYFRRIEYTPKNAISKGPKLMIVSGMVHDKTGEYPDAVVSWRISTKQGKPARIIDLEVENISMLITQQQENTAIIRQNGGSFKALIDALNQQADDIAAGKTTASD